MIEEGSGAVVRDARNSREKGEGRKRVLNFAQKPEVAFQQGASYASSTDLKDEEKVLWRRGNERRTLQNTLCVTRRRTKKKDQQPTSKA